MTSTEIIGLASLVVFGLLIVGFMFYVRYKGPRQIAVREIAAYEGLPETVGAAVEAGRSLHVSLGSGVIGEASTATTLVGLSVLDKISAAAVVSDRTPVVTTGDGTAMLLAQDTMRSVYARQNALHRYNVAATQVAGLGSQPYSAAVTGLIKDEKSAATILLGSIGPEAALFAEAGQHANITTLAGTDDPTAQALLFATADSPVVGEDLYAAGAYIGRDPAHLASLKAQDVMRFAIIGAILVGSAGALFLPGIFK